MRTRFAFIIAALLIAIIVTFSFAQPISKSPQSAAPDAITGVHVVFIIRHADTDPKGGNNPPLTAQGQARAQHLAHVLQDEELSAVFVTNTTRSLQTATPAAAAAGVTPTVYPALDADAIASTINGLDNPSATLVIAHSNTTPTIIAALGGPSLPDLDHDAFDHMYALVIKGGRHVRTLELRY